MGEQRLQRPSVGLREAQLAPEPRHRPARALPRQASAGEHLAFQLGGDAQVLEPRAAADQLLDLLARPAAGPRLGPEAVAQGLDLAGQPAVPDEPLQCLRFELQLGGNGAGRAPVAGEQAAQEVALPLAQLALQAGRAEPGEQHALGQRVPGSAEPRGERRGGTAPPATGAASGSAPAGVGVASPSTAGADSVRAERARRRTGGPLGAPGTARATGRSNSLPRVSRYALRRAYSSSSESPSERATRGASRCQAKSESSRSARARRSCATGRVPRPERAFGEVAAIEAAHPKEATGEVKPLSKAQRRPTGGDCRRRLDAAASSG